MNKRIFISFAKEDMHFRDLLKGQARNEYSPFEFVDMSVKKPWDSKWKTHCRTKIKGCDGMIAIVTSNTQNADGELWEIKCANSENIPVVGIYGYKFHSGTIPSDCGDVKIMDWTWNNIANWIKTL
jgi:hypothetical protein